MTLKAKLLIACLILILAPAAGGWFAWKLQRNLGELAISIYDSAVVGVSHIGKAQADFVRYAAAPAANGDRLEKIADYLAIASERATSDRARTATDKVRDSVRTLQASGHAPAAEQLAELDTLLGKAVKRFDADGLESRDGAETMVDVSRVWMRSIGLAVIGMVALIGLVLWRAVIPPLRRAEAVATAISEGKLDNSIRLKGRDEAAQLLRALDIMQRSIAGNLAKIEAMRAQDRDNEAHAQAALAEGLRAMADRVEYEVGEAVKNAGQQMADMAGQAKGLSHEVERLLQTSDVVRVQAGQALDDSEMTVSVAERIAEAMRTIAESVTRSSDITRRAVRAGGQASDSIGRLATAAKRIADAADIIGSIARQTNLLALNATIEAARAGEAGKGFAVVASEVKTLAAQTARSTTDIAAILREIQGLVEITVRAVTDVGDTLMEAEEVARIVAGEVERQDLATREIAEKLNDLAGATRLVAREIADVHDIARSAGDVAVLVDGSSTRVNEQVQQLQRVVVRVIRSAAPHVNRRESPRIDCWLPCLLTTATQGDLKAETRNLSRFGAALICPSQQSLRSGENGMLTLQGTAPVPFTAVTHEGDLLRVHLTLSETALETWCRWLESLESTNQPRAA